MPKAITGNPRRKPPEPSADHSDIDDWLALLVPQLQPIVEELDQVIRAGVRGLQYGVKFNRAFYGRPELGWVIEVAPYYVSVNALFFGGADFKPPPPLGTTGRTRYVKLTRLDDVKQPELSEWIKQSGRTSGWKVGASGA